MEGVSKEGRDGSVPYRRGESCRDGGDADAGGGCGDAAAVWQRSAQMAIVYDYTAIAAELRRLQLEKLSADDSASGVPAEPVRQHRMQTTVAGNLLYRRLVLRRVPRS